MHGRSSRDQFPSGTRPADILLCSTGQGQELLWVSQIKVTTAPPLPFPAPQSFSRAGVSPHLFPVVSPHSFQIPAHSSRHMRNPFVSSSRLILIPAGSYCNRYSRASSQQCGWLITFMFLRGYSVEICQEESKKSGRKCPPVHWLRLFCIAQPDTTHIALGGLGGPVTQGRPQGCWGRLLAGVLSCFPTRALQGLETSPHEGILNNSWNPLSRDLSANP